MRETLEGVDREAASARERIQKEQVAQVTALNEKEAEAQGILQSMQSAAAGTGVARHGELFSKESAEHQEAAKNWMWATIASGVATLAFALYNLFYGLDDTVTFAVSLQSVVGRLIVFSVFGAAVTWSARNYRAHRHNAVINRHRQNALGTFEAFAKGADDPSVRDAVLVRSTEAIFSQVGSGYQGRARDNSSGSSQIIEVLRKSGATNVGDD